MNDSAPELSRWMRGSLVAGAIGLGVCAAAALALPFGAAHFFRAWLVAFHLFLGASLGSLVVLMIQYVTGGVWGWVLRPTLEAASRTLPLMALLFLPVCFGMDYVFEWSRFQSVRHDPELRQQALYEHVEIDDHELEHKLPYLNRGFFYVRAAICFGAWCLVMAVLNRWSRTQKDRGPRESFSAPSLLLYAVTVTFASIDWGMSLEPRWYSTIYGVMLGIGQVLSGFALCVAVFLLLAHRKDLEQAVQGQNMSDLGTLLGAFVILWAYLSFMQFLTIWQGQLPEELPWYIVRTKETGWRWAALALVVFHFALPFALLLSFDVKRNRLRLAAVAILMCAMRVVDIYWLLVPAFLHDGSGVDPLAVSAFVLYPAALAGIGGLWFAAFLWQLRSRPLLPTYSYEEEASDGQAAAAG